MKTFLIVAERPKTAKGDDDVVPWRTFVAATGKALPPSTNAKRLTEGIWQMPLDGGLKSLLDLLMVAAEHKMPIQLALLDDAPAWIKYS
jgi:hypothetical protein